MMAVVVARTGYREADGSARDPDSRIAAVLLKESATDLDEHARPAPPPTSVGGRAAAATRRYRSPLPDPLTT